MIPFIENAPKVLLFGATTIINSYCILNDGDIENENKDILEIKFNVYFIDW